MNLRVISVGDEPLQLGEVKAFLRVEHDEDDQEILSMITAAREQAELHHGRELARKEYDFYLDCWPAYGAIALLAPLVSVTSITYRRLDGSEATLAAGVDYFADTRSEPGQAVCWPGKRWPSEDLWPAAPISIRFTCGYLPTEVPKALRAGMKMLISGWYDNRSGFSVGNIAHALPFAVQSCFEVDRLIRF